MTGSSAMTCRVASSSRASKMTRPVLMVPSAGPAEDQLPLGQQALQPLEVLGSDRLLDGRHGPGEVIGGGRMK
jgi:hypothetical protein